MISSFTKNLMFIIILIFIACHYYIIVYLYIIYYIIYIKIIIYSELQLKKKKNRIVLFLVEHYTIKTNIESYKK